MISTRRTPGHRQVRLHHMFLDADVRTLTALGGYLDRTDPGAGEVLGRFIERHRGNIRHRQPRRIAIAVNRDVIPRSAFAPHQLAADARVEILEAVGGG